MSLPLKKPRQPTTDRELAARAAAGATEALGELYRRYAPRLGLLAYRLLGCRPDAEDVVQDLFVGLPDALDRYHDEGKLEAWLRRIAVNLSLKRLRGVRRRREGPLPDSLTGPEAAGRTDRIQVERAVNGLPVGLRTVVILKLVEGYSHHEIGQLLGITRGASEVRLSRALNRLRQELGDEDVT